jgi:hypothetical protein
MAKIMLILQSWLSGNQHSNVRLSLSQLTYNIGKSVMVVMR